MEMVNGFQCKDCTDVGYAKRHIDPAHPKDGPYGVNAPEGSGRGADEDRAVKFGGLLRGMDDVQTASAISPARAVGQVFDLSV